MYIRQAMQYVVRQWNAYLVLQQIQLQTEEKVDAGNLALFIKFPAE